MAVTNEEVVRAWIKGRPLASRHLLTDGSSLYSYELKIGTTEYSIPSIGVVKMVYDFMGKHKITPTTSRHVSLAKRYADGVIDEFRVLHRVKSEWLGIPEDDTFGYTRGFWETYKGVNLNGRHR